MKVLFIGNSHTYVHYVPLRVKTYCHENGLDIDAFMITQPGMGLDWHLEQSNIYFDLMYGNFDAVVLQHKAHPFPGEESIVENVKKVAAITPKNTKIYLYMTWSEKNNPEGQEAMSAAYEKAAAEIGAQVCPVGRIWHKIRTLHPDEELYFRDGQHSSVLGASLSAAVIGNTLMDRSLTAEEYYAEAKKLEKMEQDSRMPDMT